MSTKLTRRQLFQFTGLGLGATALTRAIPAFAKNESPPYRMKNLYHGVAYYPELWPQEDVDRDITEMKKLGINVVRMGEFAWSTMEPEQGNFQFDFFLSVMDKMHAADIDVVLCTPTATPPIWLTFNHPERLFKNADGEILIHGARQHLSYENPDVRQACIQVISAMAQALGQHPALIGWQIDNEMKAHVAEDFSDAAVANWHSWLKQRFGSIDALNDAWGTDIWSERYQSFEQVPAPLKTPFLHNASLSTAYRMFNRESIADFMVSQRKTLRRYSNAPITHNDNPAFNLHHEASMEALDFASFDAYPSTGQWSALVFRSDFCRAAIPGRPFWLMETSVSHNGWLGNHHTMHPPGFLAAEAALIYTLGGEAFCYWLWRQQRTGAELPHSAVMSAWFKPGIGYEEVKKVEAVRAQLAPLLTDCTIAPAQVAVTYSDHARAMLETEPLDKRRGFPSRYRDVVHLWQAQVQACGYHRDVRFEDASLDDLRLLITPAMPYVSEDFLARVNAFVEAGGVWIAGPVTGTRGKEHTVPTQAGLGLLDRFAGITTEFVIPLTETDTYGKAFEQQIRLSGWSAVMRPQQGTRVIGTIETGAAAGLAFLTERKIGNGKVVVLGAQPDGEDSVAFMRTLIHHFAQQAGVSNAINAPEGVVVTPYTDAQQRSLWLAVNMLEKEQRLEIPKQTHDAIDGKAITESEVTLAGFGWRALRPGKG